ncbi:hypothetical protein BT69DRAFT_1285238 [Atractiella rhizophila]|nr:hypothetical protein BT69DRAFT_1285238 [Atractiella rhizophila]
MRYLLLSSIFIQFVLAIFLRSAVDRLLLRDRYSLDPVHPRSFDKSYDLEQGFGSFDLEGADVPTRAKRWNPSPSPSPSPSWKEHERKKERKCKKGDKGCHAEENKKSSKQIYEGHFEKIKENNVKPIRRVEDEETCVEGMRLCPSSTSGSFECVDLDDIFNCGGCAQSGDGVDCAAKHPGARSLSCVKNKCVVHGCQAGYRYSFGGTCVLP